MSAGYATKLSYREDLGGQLGDPELHDSTEDISTKAALLAEWVLPVFHLLFIPSYQAAGLSCGPSFCCSCHRAVTLWRLRALAYQPPVAYLTSEAPLAFGHCRELTSQSLNSKSALVWPSPA